MTTVTVRKRGQRFVSEFSAPAGLDTGRRNEAV